MDSAVALVIASLVAGAYDPVIDTALNPSTGLSVGVGVQRLQDDFGLSVRVASPHFLDDRLAVALTGGVGWYPDLRALPENEDQQNYGSWSMYGHARLLLEASVPIAVAAGRLYVALGPSALLLSESISTTRLALGVYGAAGAELFAGDGYRSYPFSFFIEIGATAHNAQADVADRRGRTVTDSTVDRMIATGLALGGGVRIYFWR